MLGAGEGLGLGQLTLSHGSLAPPCGPDHGLAVVRDLGAGPTLPPGRGPPQGLASVTALS
jgi:hypothetical protein